VSMKPRKGEVSSAGHSLGGGEGRAGGVGTMTSSAGGHSVAGDFRCWSGCARRDCRDIRALFNTPVLAELATVVGRGNDLVDVRPTG